MRSAINTALFILFLLLAFLTSVASHAADCPIGIVNTSVSWVWSKYGNRPYVCSSNCKSVPDSLVLCLPDADSCSSDFITDGSACPDSNGMVSGGEYPDIPEPPVAELIPKFTNTNPDSASVFTAQNLYKLNYFADGVDTVSADLERFKEFLNVTNRNLNNASHTVSSNTRIIDSGFLHIENKLNATNTKVDGLYSKMQEVKQAVDGIDSGGGTGGGGSVDVTAIKNSIDNSLVPNSYILNNNIQTMTGRLDNIKNSLDNNHNSQTNFFARKMDELISAVGSSGGGDGDGDGGGDNSGVINALNNQTTELKGGLNSLSQGIDSLNDALSTGSYVSREFKGKVDFDTVGLYKPDLLESVLADTEELKQQYEQQIDEFKKIFSFDVSQLNSGQYKEHSLDFVLPNGKQLNLKSGVLPAFIDQANLIAAVILFIASVIAVKAILGSRK
ncbi:hypothetical protein [Vibrio sp. V15_P4S5T153]|uniref:hypothetical protein n=1 Tax=Vibrio sp. V15_P4S5T153 TaxID=1938669 RepID=UPI000B8F4593|nr:hypothetical protein [Vibrio sp. V15_P4S5T153]OXX59523.1 hypothetical protein B9J89_21320 [Vibrio sp. V15_P4S5T153]